MVEGVPAPFGRAKGAPRDCRRARGARRFVARTRATACVSALPIGRRRPCAPRPPVWPIAPGSTRARDAAHESAGRSRPAHWSTSMARDDRLGEPSAHSDRPPKRRGIGGSRAGPELSKGCPGVISHRQARVPCRRSQRLDVHADQQREHGQRKERVIIVIAMGCQRTRACEHLRRRDPPSGIPRPIRLGGHTERRRERRLRLAQCDPALTQRAGLHDVTPCHGAGA